MKKVMAVLVVIFLTLCLGALGLLAGCAGNAGKLDPNYALYLESVKNMKTVEMVAKEGESIELKGVKSFIVYASGNVQIQPYQAPLSVGSIFARELGLTLRTGMPYALGWKALDVMQAGIRNAGHNTTGSYNTDRHDIVDYSGSTNDSNNRTNSNDAVNSYNGNYRDIAGEANQDNRQNYENPVDNKQNYENPVTSNAP